MITMNPPFLSRSARFAAGAALALLSVPAIIPAAAAQKPLTVSEEVAVLTTPYGEIVWRFFPDAAPRHVAYVKELIRRGFYDGTTFHRVIPHFVAQGGDPNSKNSSRADDGEGEADRRVPAEFSTVLHYRPGTVGMARDSDPDSGSCQFFIALESLPRLDGRYTIFGEVVSGLDVARALAERPRDLNDNPLERITIRARLRRRRVPVADLSRTAPAPGEPGEVLTGPGKPRLLDPGNVRWKAPARTINAGSSAGPDLAGPGRIELATDETGRVIDVRFPEEGPGGAAAGEDAPAAAAALRAAAFGWSFFAARFDDAPVKARFATDLAGGAVGPPIGGGAPLLLAPVASEDGIERPHPLVRVELPAGVNGPAAKSPMTTLRLLVDETGTVTEAWVQVSCGVPALDARAADEARRLVFAPARRPVAGGNPEPVASYFDAEARFVESPAPASGP